MRDPQERRAVLEVELCESRALLKRRPNGWVLEVAEWPEHLDETLWKPRISVEMKWKIIGP